MQIDGPHAGRTPQPHGVAPANGTDILECSLQAAPFSTSQQADPPLADSTPAGKPVTLVAPPGLRAARGWPPTVPQFAFLNFQFSFFNRLSAAPRHIWAILLLTVSLCLAAASCFAQAEVEQAQGKPLTFWQIIVAGGITELIIILCSFAAVTLIIEHFVSIRFVKAIPPELYEKVRARMGAKEYNEVLRLCEANPCFFTNVIASGLRKLRYDFVAVQESVAETIEKEGAALHSKISYLSFIASVSPMLGLLGTVTGMIDCFNKIAWYQGLGRASLLAKGVYEALITTATGLIVAIPVMAFFFFFRDRVNKIILEVETLATELFEPFRPTRKTE